VDGIATARRMAKNLQIAAGPIDLKRIILCFSRNRGNESG
jgi:hypothetical protein